MRQIDLLASPTPDPVATDDDVPRDLFGAPIRPTGPAAPKYRPRKPVQQSIAFDTFTLEIK